jgi:D-sedoheptulose 7-phosphate isomerase
VGLTFAYANDVSFEDVFVEQLKNLLNEGDLVIAISGSGNSENVLRAVRYANDHGAVTLGLCGYGGGTLRQIAQHVVWVNVNDMQLSEDIHSMFGHVVMQRLCLEVHKSAAPIPSHQLRRRIEWNSDLEIQIRDV